MNNSYRIRTKVGVDSYLSVQLDQDFEYLEILSLKILPEQIYTRPCSDYGVIVGRLTVNGGYGIPNVKVSIFIPISEQDKLNPLIYDLYPYEKITDQNEDGYRYNLLPYKKSYSAHNPTGTFFDREDVLVSPPLIEVYDKYYKYCASTNSSGDFMIFGAPIGTYTLHADIDLSDIGEFSLSPQDLIRMGIANPGQVAGVKFKSSENLNELPQIISMNKAIEVQPLWGQPELCNLGVNRVDFDLTKETKIQITPTAIFIGSLISGTDEDYQKRKCKPTLNLGDQCSLIAGPGIIQALRQTLFIDPVTGYPGLEVYDLEQGGQVIDDNGAWMLDVPMNLDYVITNEFGEQVISPDPKVGIPTKGKYRFKIKWVQGDTLSEPIKRGYFLVPNVREYWTDESDPFNSLDGQFQLITNELPNYSSIAALAEKSYSFSTDWNDYPDPQVAIQCEDYFYELTYNKVYTVSQMMDSYNSGYLLNRKIAIKNILNSECASENNKFPVNDGQYRFDLIFILFSILLLVTFIIMNVIVLLFHIIGILLQILGQFLGFMLRIIVFILRMICDFINDIILESLRSIGLPAVNLDFGVWSGCVVFCPDGWYPLDFLTNVTWCDEAADQLTVWAEFIENLYKKFQNVQVPMLTYPDCELCDCSVGESTPGNDTESVENDPNLGIQKLVAQQLNRNSFLAPITLSLIFNKTTKFIPNLPDKKILYAPIALSSVGMYAPRDQNVPNNTISLPDGRSTFYRNAFLIKGSEFDFRYGTQFKQFTPTQRNLTITSIGLMYKTGGSNSSNISPTYSFQLRFQNTTDSTYLKGTTWSNIISGMTVTNPANVTIPRAGVDPFTYVNLSAPFTYNIGDNLYVAMDVGGLVSGDFFSPVEPAIMSANATGLLSGLTWGWSDVSGPNTLMYDNKRPLIILFTSLPVPTLGVTPISMFYRAQSTKVAAFLSGQENDNDFLVSSKTRVPQSYLFGQNIDYNYFSLRAQNPVSNIRVAFSLSLPISERMNLFNLKSKYFNENLDSYHGLGVNRIKVTFNTNLNGGPNKYHYDNTLTLLVNNDQLRKLKPGQLLSFQNPILSRDNSLNGLTDLNQYGGLSVTGTAINTTGETMVNITYANPDGSGDLVVGYNLPQEDGDMYAKFPTDMEYFMVITAMTYNTFSGMCNPKETEVTLNKRYLGNSSKIEILKTEYGCWDYEASSAFTVNSLKSISDGNRQGVAICVRGVDPNSTREINKYDLSWLFGYNTDSAWGQRSELIVEGEYYLNHPIKGNINSVSHDISSNLETEIDLDYLNGATNTLYHDSFRFKPAFSGNASFSSYTTNLPMYYSSFDKLTPSGGNNIYKPDNGLTTPPFSEAIQTPYGDGVTTNCLPSQSNLFVKEFKRQTNLNLLITPAPSEDGVCYPCTDYNPTWINFIGSGFSYNQWGYCVKLDPNHMNINTPYHSKVYSYNTLGVFGTITAVANAYWTDIGSSLLSYKSYSLVAYSGDSVQTNQQQYSGASTIARIEIRDENRNLVDTKLLYYDRPPNIDIIISKIKILTFKWGEVAIVKLDSYSSPSLNKLNISFWTQDFNVGDQLRDSNTLTEPVNFLGESLININNLNFSGNSSFIDFDIEVDYISTNIILMFPVPSNSNMIVGGTALAVGVPVLMFISRAQRYLPDQLIPNTFLNNSIFLPISTFPVNKTKITLYNEILVLADLSEITLYACGYIKTSDSTLYVSVFDNNGILIKTFGPTSADNVGTYTNGSEILTTDTVTSFSLDFNPLSKELIVCWINSDNKIYYQAFNVSLDYEVEIIPGTTILVPNITLKTINQQILANGVEVTFDSGANGIPSDVILKVNRITKQFVISWQTPEKGVFIMKYFTLTSTDFPSPLLLLNSNHTQTGTTIYDLGTNYGTLSSFNITFKENTNNGVITKQVYSIFMDIEVLNRGYYQNEFLEGGGVMYLKSKYGTILGGYNSQDQYLNNFGKWGYHGYYYSPTYDKSKQIEISITEDTCKLIMRSDRLPTSTTENKVDSSYGGNSSFTLHANQYFTAYLFDENGRSFSLGGKPKIPTIFESLQDDTGENFATNVLATTTCDGLVPLDCYTTDNNTVGVKPSGDDCYYNGIGKIETDKIMKGGCYVLVTKVWDTLEKDLILLGEWRNRINVNFAACRNVFGHVFRNNWINGTLFAFPIKNDRVFTPIFRKFKKVSTKNPVATDWGIFFEPNSPYSKYCKDTVRLHSKTNEFYYRSSPFFKSDDEGAFIGITNLDSGGGRNNKFIKFPTTIMDLGPRSKYLQEIVMSDDLDGYNIGNLNKSSFSDVSSLLNLFILSRTVTKSFTFLITSFFSRSLYIDGDYAQMVATNSQVGIAPFDESNYGNQTGSTSNPVFYANTAQSLAKIGPTFGVFYNSDLEIRDLVSPRRTLINGDVPNNFCAFNELSNFSQRIPMYQWEIKQTITFNDNEETTPWIFGNETNDWYTDLVTTTTEETETFFSYKYQYLDRLETQSRFFRTNIDSKTNFFKGYIYAVGDGPGTAITINSDVSKWSRNSVPSDNNNLITFGTPFYFYFGLKNGKTAIDLFKRKWINSENVII